MNTIEKISKETQDYSDLGFGVITTYTKSFFIDGEYRGQTKYYTYTVNGVESKKYYQRGWACKGMFKAAKVAA